MRRRLFVALVAIFGILIAASPVYSGPSITAAYTVVAVQPDVNGSLISLDVTVTNNGTIDLNSLVINEINPIRLGGNSNALNVGSLVVGAQNVQLWTISSSIPADQVSAKFPLYFQGTATDANNNSVVVAVEGVAK